MADPIDTALAVTDYALRQVFPNDFHKRCMYAAIATATLLQEAGVEAHVVGGDFLCLMVSRNGRNMNGQGFGSSSSPAPSHYWTVAKGLMIDLGPSYLVHESSFPAVEPPIVRWRQTAPLPGFLAYRARTENAHDAPLDDRAIQRRLEGFLSHCRALRSSGVAIATLRHWQLKDFASLKIAARARDPWAIAAAHAFRRGVRLAFPG